MNEQVFALLSKFYPPEGMFLQEVSDFSASTSSVVGRFNVPKDAAYSIIPLGYVTAEQHVRCFSQLSYGLMYLLSMYHKDATSYGGPTDFERLMYSGKMWYRRMNTRFLKSVAKGDDFTLMMEMTGIRKRGPFAITSLRAKGPIMVSSEFVAPL